ncbi:MAG: thioredoxin family protein [Thermoanaerobaculia bacterium]
MKTPRLALALFGTTLALACVAPAEPPAAPRIGAVAPDFTLPSAAGGQAVALKDLLGKSKAVVVIFDATKCPYAIGYKERVAKMGKEYAGKGVTFVTINSNKTEPSAEVAEDAKKHGFAFPVLKDEGNKVADLYGAQKTPEIYVLDPKGTLLYRGRIDETHEEPENVKSPDLINALEAILAGKPVPAAETKAFGCTIKRV